MGNPTGFIEYERKSTGTRAPEERLLDWEEFRLALDDDALQKQGARCMDCAVPFCHGGFQIGGQAAGCPVHNLIPEWNHLVYQSQWKEAYFRLSKTNDFPEFTGRVCPAPCESACVLGINAAPVAIKTLECAIIDRAFKEGWVRPQIPSTRTGRKIAIVGSGPAGLACASQLNRVGHTVSVFERDDRIGGLLVYGIPSMKLDKGLVQRRIDLLVAEGIQFFTNTEVGVDYPVEKLLIEFDAVVLCAGATHPRDLPIEGRGLQGIHFAMEFLKSNTKSWLDCRHQDGQFLSAEDREVVVIGGGDTGTDCVATALRHGCRSLFQFEILPKPPSERSEENPWPRWPHVFLSDYGHEEAKALFGRDPREHSIMTKRFVGDSRGHLVGLHICRVKWVNKDGRLIPRELPGTDQVIPTQLVLLALGYTGPEAGFLDQLGIERDTDSIAATPSGSYATDLPGVFVAGDLRRGQSLVVWAIREGREAARECDFYLMGTTSLS